MHSALKVSYVNPWTLQDFEGVAARTFRVKYLIVFYIFDIEVKLCNGAMRSGCLQRGTAKDPDIAILVLWVWRIVIKKQKTNTYL